MKRWEKTLTKKVEIHRTVSKMVGKHTNINRKGGENHKHYKIKIVGKQTLTEKVENHTLTEKI